MLFPSHLLYHLGSLICFGSQPNISCDLGEIDTCILNDAEAPMHETRLELCGVLFCGWMFLSY